MPVRFTMEGQFPEAELEPLLQAIRAWERGRPGVEVAVKFETTHEIEDALAIYRRLTPPVPFESVVRTPRYRMTATTFERGSEVFARVVPVRDDDGGDWMRAPGR